MTHSLRLLSVATTFLSITSVARADDAAETSDANVKPAIDGALELAAVSAYTMSRGEIGADLPSAKDLIGPGFALELQVGYRIVPALAIGAYGTLQGFSDGSGHPSDPSSHGGAAGIKADYHLKPRGDVDSWISVGAGVRWLQVDDDGAHSTLLGAELARLQLGADFRVTDDLSLGPVVGASASVYQAQDTPASSGYEDVAGKGVHWTLSAGVVVRFDAFGRRV